MRVLITESQLRVIIDRTHKLLNENLYGKKIIDQLIKRWNVEIDDKLEDKLAIAGLWRDKFGDINKIGSVEELDNKFNVWYNNFIGELVKLSDFVDNEEMAKTYLNGFVDNIKSLKDKAVKVSPKNLKKFVDGHNNWVEVDERYVDIYSPRNKDVLFENDEIIILDSNTRDKCVIYGKGEQWCITKTDNNYFNTYRVDEKATIYFVLQKNIEGDEHKLVIMVYDDDLYSIADRSNTGKRTGLKNNAIGWSDVENQIPNLRGLKEYFKYVPLTEWEINYERLARSFPFKFEESNLPLQEALDKEVESFKLKYGNVNITSADFIRDITKENKRWNWIPFNQIQTLNEKTMNSLIETNYFTGKGFEESYDLYGLPNLSKSQKNRIIQLKAKDNMLTLIDWVNMDFETKIKNGFIKRHVRLDYPSFYLKDLESKLIDYYIEINYFAHNPPAIEYINYYNFDNITDKQKQLIFLQRLNAGILYPKDIEYMLKTSPPKDFFVQSWDDFFVREPFKYNFEYPNTSIFKGYFSYLDNNQIKNVLDKIISYHKLKDGNVMNNPFLKKFVLQQYVKLDGLTPEQLKELAKELIGDYPPGKFIR